MWQLMEAAELSFLGITFKALSKGIQITYMWPPKSKVSPWALYLLLGSRKDQVSNLFFTRYILAGPRPLN